jgi:vancomycin resistance protein YoaR
MRPDDSSGQPPLVPPGAAARDEFENTRPVTRDWLLGAPDTDQAEQVPAAPPAEPEPEAATPETATPDAASATDDTTILDRTEADPGAPDEQGTDVAESGPPGDGPGGHGGPGGPRGPRAPWWRRKAALVPAAALVLLGAAYGLDLLISSGDIPRHTVVAGLDIGGLSPAAAAAALEQELAPRVAAEHTVVADGVEAALSPSAAGIALDVDGTVDVADDQPLNPWTRLVTLFGDRAVDPVLSQDDTALAAQLETIATQVDRAAVDATIAIDGTTPSVVQPADGRQLDREGSADALIGALASGRDPKTPIELPVDVAPVHVDADEAQRVLDETVTPALSAPVSIVSQDGTTHTEIPVAAIASSLTFSPQDDGTLAVGIDPEALQTALGDELGQFGTPAEDARFEVSGGSVSVVPSVDGTGIDPTHLAEQLLPVLTDPAPRSVTADLGPVPADFTTEEAQALGVKEQISSFTTHFTSSASGTNIRVVAAEVDGALVKPGETFSLNTFTGPRGTAQGYVEAAVISGGQLSKAVGGGISQFATTMFNAVFFAGLEDVHHKPHSFYISRYPAGREATVYEGVIDLQWRNDGDTGVYVDTSWSPGSITVTFYGTKRYEIEAIEGPRTNHREPAVQDKVDDGNCTPQSGVPGFDVTVTRIFRDLGTGAEIRRENFQTHYAAEAVIHCIPPDSGTSPPPPNGTTSGGSPSPHGRRPGSRRVL